MKINVIIWFLIILFTILLIQLIMGDIKAILMKEGVKEGVQEGMQEKMQEGMQEGMDDCLVGTLSDIKIQIAELQKQVNDNSEELKKLNTPVLDPPTESEKEAYSKVSDMSELMNPESN